MRAFFINDFKFYIVAAGFFCAVAPGIDCQFAAMIFLNDFNAFYYFSNCCSD